MKYIDAAKQTFRAKWYEIIFARIFGKKIVGLDSGCTVIMRYWRGKYYLMGCTVDGKPWK